MSKFNFEEGALYKIKNYKSGRVVGVSGGNDHNDEDGRNLIIFDDILSAEDQLFHVFTSEHGNLMFASLKSGKVIGVIGGSPAAAAKKGANLIQWTPSETGNDQLWSVENIPGHGELYRINNYNSGMVAGVDGGENDNIDNDRPLVQWPYLSHANDQKWQFVKKKNITIPALPNINELPPYPEYKSKPSESLPPYFPAKPVLTHVARIPYVFVKDNMLTPKTQIELTPYYTVERTEQWRKITDLTIQPGYTEKYTYTQGITQKTQETLNAELNFQIGSDAGIDIKGILTAKMNWQLSTKLGYSRTTSKDILEEKVVSLEQSNPFQTDFSYTKYIRHITLSLKRLDGTVVNRYEYADPNTIKTTSYPRVDPIKG